MTSLDDLASHSPSLQEQKLTADSDDGDTASQRSISLSSPAVSARNSVQVDHPQLRQSESYESSNTSRYKFHDVDDPLSSDTLSKRESRPYTLDTDFSSDADDMSYASHDMVQHESPNTSASGSILDEPKAPSPMLSPPTYPPRRHSDVESIAESFASGSSKKARPESILLQPPPGKLVLGIALVDFNHLVRIDHIIPLPNHLFYLEHSRLVQESNGQKVKFLRTRKSSRWYRFSLCLTVHISLVTLYTSFNAMLMSCTLEC